MFWIVCDPSSGSIELYLTEIRSGSLMFVVCLVGVWQRNLEPVVCVCGTTGWFAACHTIHTHQWFKITLPNTDQAHDKTSVNHYEFQSSTALYSLMMDRIRSETCLSDS